MPDSNPAPDIEGAQPSAVVYERISGRHLPHYLTSETGGEPMWDVSMVLDVEVPFTPQRPAGLATDQLALSGRSLDVEIPVLSVESAQRLLNSLGVDSDAESYQAYFDRLISTLPRNSRLHPPAPGSLCPPQVAADYARHYTARQAEDALIHEVQQECRDFYWHSVSCVCAFCIRQDDNMEAIWEVVPTSLRLFEQEDSL